MKGKPRKLRRGGNQERQDRLEQLVATVRDPGASVRHQAAKTEILALSEGSVRQVVNRIDTRQCNEIERDDLYQQACMSLLTEVIEKYDASKGCGFLVFAKRVMGVRLIDYCRTHSRNAQIWHQLPNEKIDESGRDDEKVEFTELPESQSLTRHTSPPDEVGDPMAKKEEIHAFFVNLYPQLSCKAKAILKAQRKGKSPYESRRQCGVSRDEFAELMVEIANKASLLAKTMGRNPLDE